MEKSRKRIAFIATSTAAVLLGGGVAVAYWTTSGTGTGTAGVGTAQTVTVTQGTAPSGLYPGIPNQEIDFSVTNPGPGSVRVSGVAIAITSISNPACTSANFVLTQPTFAPVDLPVGPTSFDGATTGAAIRMIDTGVNQNACQGVTVNLGFTAS